MTEEGVHTNQGGVKAMADPITGTTVTGKDGTITETFEVSDAGVQRIRNDIPVGVGGVAIDRIPWHERGAALVAGGTYVKRIGGQDRCLRQVQVQLKGGSIGLFHCSRPCMSAGSDGDKYCPEHDKSIFMPNQSNPPNPAKNRITNSASIELTDAEKTVHYTDKEGKKMTAKLEEGKDLAINRAVKPGEERLDIASPVQTERKRARRGTAAPRRSASPKGGSIVLRFTIEELRAENMIDNLRNRLVDAINALPAKNVAEMEDVIRVRERVKKELQYQEEGK